jgi:DNA-binding beta-propeller fold protein YncE
VAAECKDDDRFDVTNWPVSDRMFFFVDKQIAAQVWDAGVGSTSVDIREPEYPEDTVFAEVQAEAVIARAVGMLGPRDIAIDAEGLLYVTDTDRNRIVVLNPQGEEVRTIGGDAPNGGSEPGQLRQPWGVAIGPDGNLYVADTWNHRVQVFNPEGEWLRGWGHEGLPAQDPSPDAFWGPRDIAVGADGTVYVADTGNKRVRVYTSEGEWLRDIGTPGAALGQVDEPSGLAINPVSGHLYVAEAWNQRIQTFDQEGFPINAWDVNMWFRNRQSFNRPYVAVSPDGTLVYVTDMDDRHRVVAYNLSGEPVLSFNHPDNLESGQLGLRSPAGMAFDAQGRLYVVDAELAQIYVFPPAEVSGNIPPGAPLDEGAETTGDDTDMTEMGVEVEIIPPPGTDESTDLTGVMDATAEATEEAAEAITAPATEEAPAG